MLGFGPISSAPLGALPDDFHVRLAVPSEDTPSSIVRVSELVGTRLVEYFIAHPDELMSIDRRRFEELVAEIWRGFGYEVELTQQTRDGGKDVIAIRRAEVETRYLIECKRPEEGTAIGVRPVRELLGVKTSEQATKAILVTTTHFSPDARLLLDKHKWELEGRDFAGLADWLARYGTLIK